VGEEKVDSRFYIITTHIFRWLPSRFDVRALDYCD